MEQVNTIQKSEQSPQLKSNKNNNQNYLQNFIKEEIIGQGSYGLVYKVRTKQGECKAMKEINKSLLNKEKKMHQIFMEKITRYFKHPGIPKFSSCFQANENIYFITEYASGGNFSSIISKQKLNFQQIRYFSAQLILILEYLHINGFSHRDFKPENMVITSEGHIQLIDFGTLNDYAPSLIKEEILKDEIKFVCPEMVLEENCDANGDLWAFACILYKLFTQKTPFWDQQELQIYEKIKQANFNCQHEKIPQKAQNLINQMLKQEQQERLGYIHIHENLTQKEVLEAYSQIKNHEFFQGFNWEQAFQCNVPDYIQCLMKQLDNGIGFEGNMVKKKKILAIFNVHKVKYIIVYKGKPGKLVYFSDKSKSKQQKIVVLDKECVLELENEDEVYFQIQGSKKKLIFKQQNNGQALQLYNICKKIIQDNQQL
ncbi:protein kinase domain protein [Ichthyophthirius multifiliis]|uniref:non-specific serine/threonine protein kinase n=1 Tax=Ichthyophthirius multifiliis TaxID=5932 RepID=G0QWS5_ICHMU|nr:protein kinase domain protein [Ichthyophthirius multifiliis]EGR30330.1 protein kinase domain protein [Ichthyophthirius multifiliis]|eukprot:XP_004031917.1 protein kinase domain protein [Ichthyophthirius multifiliis]